MHASQFVHACAGAAVTFVVGCSASSPGAGPDVGLSSDELRALGPSEVVGDLRYGQTSAIVSYTEVPKYRAFRFQGHAGDAIDAWVRSTNGDARAWLLDASFANVVSNDNASASTHDSHLVATLTQGGAYYIAFREVTGEDASFTVSLQGTSASPTCDPEEGSCPPPPPPPGCVSNCGTGQIVQGADRSFALGTSKSNELLETWGKGLWEGFISFNLQVTGEPTIDHATVTDATGASYASTGTSTRYVRIPLPVTLRGSSDSSVPSTASMTGISYEVTRVNPIPAQSLRGQFNGVTPAQVIEIGTDIPGVALQVSSSATFFRNFTNGNGCGRLLLNDKELTAASPVGTFSLVAPLRITSSASCVSSRASSPQDASADFSVGLSSISVGNPR